MRPLRASLASYGVRLRITGRSPVFFFGVMISVYSFTPSRIGTSASRITKSSCGKASLKGCSSAATSALEMRAKTSQANAIVRGTVVRYLDTRWILAAVDMSLSSHGYHGGMNSVTMPFGISDI